MGLGLICLGLNIDYSNQRIPQGVFIKLSYKFIREPDFIIKTQKAPPVLNGFYARPELIFVAHSIKNLKYNYQTNAITLINKQNVLGYAIMLNLGKQWFFNNRFCLDIFAGLGIGEKQTNVAKEYSNIYYSDMEDLKIGFFAGSNNSIDFCTQFGLKVGYLLNWKK